MAEQPTNEPPKVRTYAGVLKEQSPHLAENLSHLTSSISDGIAGAMLNMSPDQQNTMLQTLRSLGHGVFTRGVSENLQNPEDVIVAFQGASALLSPEPSENEGAQQMVDRLKQRYSIK
ncbi:MAG: hypothetical protein HYV40_01995 [Candidatus Levybacteria bacterium]|nr:hypothetical protein [Candidatus Levybacteria bacterium]